MKKFVLLALVGLTSAIHLSEDPAPATPADVAPKPPAPQTEEEKKAKIKEVESAKADQDAADKKALKAMNQEIEEVKKAEEKEKSDYDKYMNSIATTTHKESQEFDKMHNDMYTRDMNERKKAKDAKLIAQGIAPKDSLIHKNDDDLTEAEKTEKLALTAEIAANKKKIEDKKKAYWEKVNKDGEDWTKDMPQKFLTGPPPPKPEPVVAKSADGEVKEAAAPAETAKVEAKDAALGDAAPKVEAVPAALA